MDYIITTYPVMYRRYLIKDVNNIEEAWTKYYDKLPKPFDEDYIDFIENDTEIELLTLKVRTIYGLTEEQLKQED
jgi:hypothetical protein